jgi:2-(1,2-epoxy-1,2-dihydrophenyl)acetyl-CoA isomerase
VEELVVERSEGVVEVTLDRPARRNALSISMWVELARRLAEIQANPEDRVLVLKGASGYFRAGGDLAGAQPEASAVQGERDGRPDRSNALDVLQSTVIAVALALHRLTKPTLAVVDGIAARAGANLALGCDLVLASGRARFGQVFIRRALPIDTGGTWLLPRLIGIQKAKELAFFGDWVDAGEAERLGLVNRVLPEEELAGVAREWAVRLAGQSAPALALMKQGLNRAFETPFAQALDDEAAALALCAATPEAAEALRAFFEKRAR